MVNYVI